MSQPPYRVLKVALRIFSAMLAIGALFMIFGERALVVWMVLMISRMLYLASRDPEHNVAIVDGLIVGLVVLAVYAITVALQCGHPADLSGTPPLGSIAGQGGVRGVLFLSTTTDGILETCWEFLTGGQGRNVAGLTPLRFGRPKTEETVKTLVPSSPCRKQTA